MGAATPLRGWVTPELRVGEFLHHLKYRVHNIGNVVGQFLSFSHRCITEVDRALKLPQHIHHFLKFSFHVRYQTD